MTQHRHPPAPRSAPSARPAPARGPLASLLALAFGFVASTVFAWVFGIVVEIAGIYFFWPEEGVRHSQALVQEDLDYIAEFPRSIIVPDTVAFARQVAGYVSWPFRKLGVLRFVERRLATPMPPAGSGSHRQVSLLLHELARYALIAMYVGQDTMIRLAIVIYALPAFGMACLLGLVDGLVRRDLRKWGGGRESSFIYHHAKKWTFWGLTGGFSLYLAWPFGGFNPAAMVLVFGAFVAWSLSVTASSFKKYL